MKTLLAGLLIIVSSAWCLDIVSTTFPATSATLWIIRQEALYLTGLLSIALMSLSMLLSIRPGWLEKPLGGLDRVYRLHKWSGILAISFGAAHWLIKQSSGMIKLLIGTEGRLPKTEYSRFIDLLREIGDEMGEPGLYIMLAMLVITLWRGFPYHIWRQLHRGMPVLYLMLAFHAAILAPPAYWMQPVGVLLGGLIAVGTIASVIALAGLIGRHRKASGKIVSVSNEGDATELTCRLDENWESHRPGQFAFITFSQLKEWPSFINGDLRIGILLHRFRGAHPFTIASADRGDQTITFYIKALGDFTRTIARRVQVGQSVTVEGPYGRFQLDRHSPRCRQVWVAGGIGVTPFLAWLESLVLRPSEVHCVDFHYCTRDREADRFVNRLQVLCSALPGVRLYIHSEKHGEVLTAQSLKATDDQAKKTEVWFCGPRGLAEGLRKGMKNTWNGRWRFHQEAFEMR